MWNEEASQFPEFVLGHSSCAVNGKILIIGGFYQKNEAHLAKIDNSVYCYNTLTNRWTTDYADFQTPRRYLSSEVIGEEVFVIGGDDDWDTRFRNTKMEVLQVNSGIWRVREQDSTDRFDIATCVSEDQLFQIGGAIAIGTSIAEVESFNTGTRVWSNLKPLPIPLSSCGSVLIDNNIYIFGGTSNHWDDPINKIFLYDIELDSWSLKSTCLPVNLSEMAVCSHDGIIYIFGGQSTPIKTPHPLIVNSTVYLFDPKTDYWQEVSEMPKGLTGLTAHEINGEIYLVGGATVDVFKRGALSADIPSINVYTPVKAPIYSLKTSLSKYAFQSKNDSCHILSKIINHHSYKVRITARLTGQSSKKVIELVLFDDGKHNDGDAADGYYGNYFKYPGVEDLFLLEIESNNLDLNEKFISGQNCRPITTLGPVEIANYCIVNQELNEDGKTLVTFSLDIKNNGYFSKTDMLSIALFSSMNSIKMVEKNSDFEAIGPGKTVKCMKDFSMLISSDYPATSLAKVQVSISSGGYSYWNYILEISVSLK